MKFKHYMHQGFIHGDAEQRGMRVCAIRESDRGRNFLYPIIPEAKRMKVFCLFCGKSPLKF